MTTINAVELRQKMAEIFKRVEGGEEIAVTYRNRPPIKLVAVEPTMPKHKPLSGLDALNSAPRKGYSFDPSKPYKEIYHEHLAEKYDTK